MENNFSGHTEGWGSDADPKNEPTYPMKKYTGDDHERLNYKRPTQQPVDVEILHSNERPNVTAVFGNATPPTGLSGAIRRYAFRYSEGSFGHWLPLLLADRVNMVEGVIDDFKKGHIPNIWSERGYNAEWKHNRTGFLKKAAVCALVTTAVVAAIVYRKKRKK
jgi:hypothetical protein